ncbi:hypothetical protein ACWEQP_26915 [Streptomyces sp. NPDC004044]
MVGLFWVSEDAVHLGAPPDGSAPGVRVAAQASDGVYGLLVPSAAAGAYTPREVELSHQALDRFVARILSPAVLSAWGRAHGAGKTPRPAEREALLRQWAQS